MVGAKQLVGLRPSPADPCYACFFSASLRRTFTVQIHSLGNVFPAKFPFRLMTISLQLRNGRGERIRTFDLLVPNQALYQAKLRPEKREAKRGRISIAVKNNLKSLHNGRTTIGKTSLDLACLRCLISVFDHLHTLEPWITFLPPIWIRLLKRLCL